MVDKRAVTVVVKRGLRDPLYLAELLNAFDENYSEAVGEGDATRMEMFMAGILLTEAKMREVDPPRGGR